MKGQINFSNFTRYFSKTKLSYKRFELHFLYPGITHDLESYQVFYGYQQFHLVYCDFAERIDINDLPQDSSRSFF